MRLIAENLAAERAGEPVFSGLNFALSDGDALVITGENGSGKSTLLRVVAGFLPALEGSVRIEGGDEPFSTIATSIHYLGHQNGMKPALTVGENLAFWQEYCGEPHCTVAEALEMVGLPEIGHLPFGYLSTGQRRRIAIAHLLVSFRPIWLLDEPTAGLDARSEAQFAALIEAHRQEGGIVVAATHQPLGLDGAGELRMGTL